MTARPRNFPKFGGVKSRPRLDFAGVGGSGRRQGTVETFTTSQNWTPPTGIRAISKLTGKGVDGQPGYSYQTYRNGYLGVQDYAFVKYTAATDTYENSQEYYYAPFVEGSVPANYCSPVNRATTSYGYLKSAFCWSFTAHTEVTANYQPATSGAASVAFDKVFAGGPSGLPAMPDTYFNILVTNNTSYFIEVPSGGSVTIEY